MNIAFIADADNESIFGGYVVQRNKTQQYLQKLGHSVTRVVDVSRLQAQAYDVLHFWTSDVIKVSACATLPIPKVATLVYIPQQYRQQHLLEDSGPVHYCCGILKSSIRRVGRNLLFPRQRASPHHALCYLIENSDLLICIAAAEAVVLQHDLGLEKPHQVVPNAADAHFFNPSAEKFVAQYGIQDFVLCVGRFEPLKNQIRLIKALAGLDYKLVLIGKPHPHHMAYFETCRAYFGPNVLHIPHIPNEDIAPAYAAARVSAQPSFYEGASLASLEAGLAGINIVTTGRSYHREYFKEMAWYCDPSDINSIRKSVEAAYNSPPRLDLQQEIAQNYTWDNAAACTVKAYERAINIVKSKSLQ